MLDGILLSVKVLAGIGLSLGGLYGFNHTIRNSNAIGTAAGEKRVLFCILVMFAGGYLIATNLYTKGLPRCVDNVGNYTQAYYNKECF